MNLQDDIFKLKQEPRNLWEQDNLRAREIRDTPSYPIQSRLNMDNLRDQQSRTNGINKGHYIISNLQRVNGNEYRSDMGDCHQLPQTDRYSIPNINGNGNGIISTRVIHGKELSPEYLMGMKILTIISPSKK